MNPNSPENKGYSQIPKRELILGPDGEIATDFSQAASNTKALNRLAVKTQEALKAERETVSRLYRTMVSANWEYYQGHLFHQHGDVYSTNQRLISKSVILDTSRPDEIIARHLILSEGKVQELKITFSRNSQDRPPNLTLGTEKSGLVSFPFTPSPWADRLYDLSSKASGKIIPRSLLSVDEHLKNCPTAVVADISLADAVDMLNELIRRREEIQHQEIAIGNENNIKSMEAVRRMHALLEQFSADDSKTAAQKTSLLARLGRRGGKRKNG